MTTRPCVHFVSPRDGLYPAYCARCGFSRTAHEQWDAWVAADTPKDKT